MLRTLWIPAAVCAGLIGAAFAFNPPQSDTSAVQPLAREAAQQFAADLLTFAWLVQESYVREVSEVDLLCRRYHRVTRICSPIAAQRCS